MSGWDFLNIAVTGTPFGPFSEPVGYAPPRRRVPVRRPAGCYGPGDDEQEPPKPAGEEADQ